MTVNISIEREPFLSPLFKNEKFWDNVFLMRKWGFVFLVIASLVAGILFRSIYYNEASIVEYLAFVLSLIIIVHFVIGQYFYLRFKKNRLTWIVSQKMLNYCKSLEELEEEERLLYENKPLHIAKIYKKSIDLAKKEIYRKKS